MWEEYWRERGKLDEQRLAGGDDDMEAEAEKEASREKRDRATETVRQSEARKRMDGCGWHDTGRDKD